MSPTDRLLAGLVPVTLLFALVLVLVLFRRLRTLRDAEAWVARVAPSPDLQDSAEGDDLAPFENEEAPAEATPQPPRVPGREPVGAGALPRRGRQ